MHAPALGRFVLVGTAWILPLAYLVRSLPLTGRSSLAGLRQLDPSMEEAAASLGAGRLRRVWRFSGNVNSILPLCTRRAPGVKFRSQCKVFNRNHATVLHSVKVVSELCRRDTSVQRQVEILDRKMTDL